MAYSLRQLERIFDRTGGRCHLCHGDLYFDDYGAPAVLDGWEVEHSRPRARGGTDHPNNLYAACVSCNRSKGTRSSAAFRRDFGLSGPPRPEPQTDWVDVLALVGFVGGGLLVLSALASPAFPVTSASTARPAPVRRPAPRSLHPYGGYPQSTSLYL